MKQKIIILVTTVLICLILSEITLSLLIVKDRDNNLSLNNLHLRPFQIPIVETKIKIDKILNQSYNNKYPNVRLLPDPNLGWIPNANYDHKDSLYFYDSEGIRIGKKQKNTKKKDAFQIAIFGDSYIHGDEVKFHSSIGYFLERLFVESGINIEVMNFAVSGFGMDQAYLRYREVNRIHNPDLILFGVQFENVKRNINIIRPLYSNITDIPYSKPRYILFNDSLKIFKNPITRIDKITEIMNNINNWEYTKFEGYYNSTDYEKRFIYNSKLISALTSLYSTFKWEFGIYNKTSEAYQVSYSIIKSFKDNCEINNQIFVPVHLPTKNDLSYLQHSFFKLFFSNDFLYQELFVQLKSITQFVETFDKLNSWSSDNNLDDLFLERHYSHVANKIIAEEIYNFIIKNYSNNIF